MTVETLTEIMAGSEIIGTWRAVDDAGDLEAFRGWNGVFQPSIPAEWTIDAHGVLCRDGLPFFHLADGVARRQTSVVEC